MLATIFSPARARARHLISSSRHLFRALLSLPQPCHGGVSPDGSLMEISKLEIFDQRKNERMKEKGDDDDDDDEGS